MNARVAELDPAYAKKERWQARRFWGSLIIAGIAITAATYAAVETNRNSAELTEVKTRVEHSACQENAAGPECQQVKRESARAANIATTCIPFFKAGYPCPRPGSTAAERQTQRQSQAGSGSAQELNSGSDGAVAPAIPGTDHGQHHPPQPQSEGGAQEPGESPPDTVSTGTTENQGPDAVSNPNDESVPGQSSGSTSIREGAGGLLEEAGSTLTEAGKSAVKTVEGVGAGVNCALSAVC